MGGGYLGGYLGGGAAVAPGVTSDVGTNEVAVTDNAVMRWDGTVAPFKAQNSVVTIADTTGNMAGVGTLGCGAITSTTFGTFNRTALGAVFAVGEEGLILRNTTDATDGTVQISPSLCLGGGAWDTANDHNVDVHAWHVPVQGATPSTTLNFGLALDGGAIGTPFLTCTSAGNATATGTLTLGAATAAEIIGMEADGGSAVGVILNTDAAYTTTAKLVSVRNNDVEKASFDINGKLTAGGGLVTKVDTSDVHDTTPTEASIITAFGTAAAAGAGFIGIIDDAGGDTNEYLVFSNGTKWMWLKAAVSA